MPRSQIFGGRVPSPTRVAAENAVGELVQRLTIGRRRIGGETTVADNLSGDALQHFLRTVLQYLQVGMAVTVDETGRDGQPRAVNRDIRGSGGCSERRDAPVFDPDIGGEWRAARSVNDGASLQRCIMGAPRANRIPRRLVRCVPLGHFVGFVHAVNRQPMRDHR